MRRGLGGCEGRGGRQTIGLGKLGLSVQTGVLFPFLANASSYLARFGPFYPPNLSWAGGPSLLPETSGLEMELLDGGEEAVLWGESSQPLVYMLG